MYPATTSKMAYSSNERRRNLRHRAPSIMYVQLGSGNGGIVLNLGIDGVAFHTAQKLTAEKNSTLQLRLRGSGLNVDLAGELVWLSPTQKEAGICFKDLPGSVRRDIADWIAREAQVFEPVKLEDASKSKPISAKSGIFETSDTSVPHALSAALTMSLPKLATPPPSANAEASGLFSPLPLDYLPPKSYLSALNELASRKFERDGYDEEWDEDPDVSDPDSSSAPEEGHVEPDLHTRTNHEPARTADTRQQPLVSTSPSLHTLERVSPAPAVLQQPAVAAPALSEHRKAEEIEPSPAPAAVSSSPYLLSLDRLTPALEEPPQASAEAPGRVEFRGADEIEPSYVPPARISSPFLLSLERRANARQTWAPVPAEPASKTEIRKMEELPPIHYARVYRVPEKSPAASPIEKWIPSALLAPWKGAGVQHKLIIATSGVACVGFFALFLSLAAAHSDRSRRVGEASIPLPQSMAEEFAAPPAATTAVTTSLPVDAVPAPAALPVVASRRILRPRKSPLELFLQALLSLGPGRSDERARIRDDQLGVQVWTSKRNGYFYCTDSDFYKSVQPGAFMVQGDAIQSGYQPRIGQFCD